MRRFAVRPVRARRQMTLRLALMAAGPSESETGEPDETEAKLRDWRGRRDSNPRPPA